MKALLLMLLAVSAFQANAENEEGTAPAVITDGSWSAEQKAIFEKYDKMTYDVESEFPLCENVLRRKQEENDELLKLALKHDPKLLELYTEMTHRYPAPALARDLGPSAKQGKTPEELVPTLSFAAGTMIRRIALIKNQKVDDLSVPIETVEPGQFVLSTTALLIKDPRYHKTCWAQVHNVVKGESSEIAKVHYRGPANERENLRVTSDACLFCKKDSKWTPTLCSNTDLEPATELFTLKAGNKDTRNCRFTEYVPEEIQKPETVVNIHVQWTGGYYIGTKGSEILIKN